MGRYGKLTSIAALAIGLGSAALGQQAPQYRFDVPPQELKYALRAVTREAGLQLLAGADDLRGLKSPGLHANLTAEEALEQLLAGSTLHAEVQGKAVFIRGRPKADDVAEATAPASTDIVVTGSRIRGAPIASPVVSLTGDDIREAGESNLGDAIRTIPQNFGGSQNPGAGLTVPDKNGTADGSGSSIDLRGLGGDATLTLLNGHRLSYSAADQAIDVSTIPLAALDRIEIVADGASALYGSDAVAGVANIILKKDFSGVRTDARFGASTDGGNEQQTYDIVGGQRWTGGGFLAAYNFAKNTSITAEDRSYAALSAPGLTLWPAAQQHSAVLAGHQIIGGIGEFAFDGIYSDRRTSSSYGLSASLDLSDYHIERFYHSKDLSLSPSLTVNLGESWTAKAEGVYGFDKSLYAIHDTLGGVTSTGQAGCYCNSLWNGELSASGRLLHLPGGYAQLAVGGGYRRTTYHGFTTTGTSQDIDAHQSTTYAFGELSLPVLPHLDLNAAGRFEDYPGVARVTTPKVGIVFQLGSSIDLKGSWGRSFKAPAFYDRFSASYADLYAPATLGGTGYPSSSTALLISGGNPDLKPERATTWSTTIAFHPRAIPALHGEISYFHVRYVQRIVPAITYLTQALNDPAYAKYVTLNPTSAELAAALAGRDFTTHIDAPYDPANVIALVNDANVNAEGQTAKGVDLNLDYRLELAHVDSIHFSLNANYLHSTQRLTADAPITALAGTIFNPPHVRARAGVAWAGSAANVAAYLNFTGGVRDARSGYDDHVASMTTLDLASSYHLRGHGVLKGVDVSLSVLNVFNAKPDRIPTTAVYETPYDSLNYSPAGRVASIAIGKSW